MMSDESKAILISIAIAGDLEEIDPCDPSNLERLQQRKQRVAAFTESLAFDLAGGSDGQ